MSFWNGNRKHWSNLFRRDPDLNILLWAWTTHASTRAKLELEAAGSAAPWVRLRQPSRRHSLARLALTTLEAAFLQARHTLETEASV